MDAKSDSARGFFRRDEPSVSLFAGLACASRRRGRSRPASRIFLNQRKIGREKMFVRLFAACGDGEAALDIYRDALAGMKEYVENENRSEEHTSELQSRENLVCRLLLEKKKNKRNRMTQ